MKGDLCFILREMFGEEMKADGSQSSEAMEQR